MENWFLYNVELTNTHNSTNMMYTHYMTPCAWLYAEDSQAYEDACLERYCRCLERISEMNQQVRDRRQAASKTAPAPAPAGNKGSHTNAELRKAIKDHFAKTGRRMNNITTADKQKLNGIIENYNIDLPEPVKKVRKTTASPTPGPHPFKSSPLGFRYNYRYDASQPGWETRNQDYHITKVSKCFITVEYDHFGKFTTKRCKVMFEAQPWRGEGAGNWYFTLDTLRIPFSEYPFHEQGDFY
jgi:hypothetical protein